MQQTIANEQSILNYIRDNALGMRGQRWRQCMSAETHRARLLLSLRRVEDGESHVAAALLAGVLVRAVVSAKHLQIETSRVDRGCALAMCRCVVSDASEHQL